MQNPRFRTIGLIFLFVILHFLSAVAEEMAASKEVKITLIGIYDHQEYQETVNGIKKIAGLADLVPTRLSTKQAIFNGLLSSDPAMFKNDIQAFVMDRFKFESRETDSRMEIILKKL